MPTERELEEMEQDMLTLERDQVTEIVREVITAEVKERVFDYELIKEELRQLNEGERIVLPKSVQHASLMLIIAKNYLTMHQEEKQ